MKGQPWGCLVPKDRYGVQYKDGGFWQVFNTENGEYVRSFDLYFAAILYLEGLLLVKRGHVVQGARLMDRAEYTRNFR